MSKRRLKKPAKLPDCGERLRKALAKRTKNDLMDVLVELEDVIRQVEPQDVAVTDERDITTGIDNEIDVRQADTAVRSL